ncbi:MAG: A/G-specific adenine glycosylase [Acholeplasmataceae bacterium]|nr:A/G-specific adenine glycosylase [Acholeplasmataceae bacterium]
MDITKLQVWYKKNHRKLSFRETNNPYYIWVSEIMLQQTQVDTVLPYFDKFIETFPTVQHLAQVDEERLIKQVEGLGYYRRFRNMHLAAKKIVEEHRGVFPTSYDDIIKLPGIGSYTAGAIMSIAYHQPYSALDGNVIRVLSRFLADDRDMRLDKHKKALNQLNQSYIEKAEPHIYTQAMMELGATVCKPKNPICENCPLAEHCVAFATHKQHEFPVLSKLKSPKNIMYKTLIIHDGNYVYLRKRDEELLKGMYEYPQFEEESIFSIEDILKEQGITVVIEPQSENYQHIFSHQKWLMDVHHARYIEGNIKDWIKIKATEIDQIPMAVAHRKIKR